MIGNKLKELRLRASQSLQDLADAVGVSKPHIWELEQNRAKNPSIELVIKLAKHFNVPITQLLDSEDSEIDALVFGHKFANATEEDKKLILQMAERVIKKDEQ